MVIKEVSKTNENSALGLLGWSFGILSIIFSILQPIAGALSGVVGLVLSSKQNKGSPDKWSSAGRILSIIGIIVSILILILGIIAIKYLVNDPNLLAQLQG